MSSENSKATVKNLEDKTLLGNESLNEMVEKIADTSFISKQIANFSNDLLKMTSTVLTSNISKIPSVFDNPFESVLTNDLYKNLLQPIYESIKNFIPELDSSTNESLIYRAHEHLGENLLAWWMDLSLEEAEQVCFYGSRNPEELDAWIENELIPHHPEFIGESFKIINDELDEDDEYLRGLSLAAQRSFERNEPEGIGASLIPIFDRIAFKYRQKEARVTAIKKNFESIYETCGEAELFECGYEIRNTYVGFAQAFLPFVESYDFIKGPEPDEPNRHWMTHGQRKKRLDMLDAYKLLSLLASLILLGRFCRDHCEVLD